MKIYIAGKVTGESIAECTMKFGTAQKEIEALGYTAINPLAVVNDFKATWQGAMRKCIASLMDADAIYILDDAGRSKGATIELELAAAISMPIYTNLKNLRTHKK